MGNAVDGISAWNLFKTGGPLLYPILLCSIFSLGFILKKLFYFASIRIKTTEFKKEVFDLVKKNKIKEAIALCDSKQSPVAQVLKAGLLRFGAPREEIKETIEEISLYEIPKLENHLAALATIAHLTPLLGFLGTVTGMASLFHVLQVRAASMNPVSAGDLAGGINEALITSMAGLLVAIPTYAAHNYCVNQAHYFVLEMERAATELISVMCHKTETKYIQEN